MRWTYVCAGIVMSLALAFACGGQSCEPTWTEGYSSGDMTGTYEDLCVFDDGQGEKLYAAGYIHAFNGNTSWYLARWETDRWQKIDSSFVFMSDPEALVAHDDGSGPALYAAGSSIMRFSMSNYPVSIVRWDGNEWSGVGNLEFDRIRALCVFDDGSGPALYAAGAAPGAGVWKWDGQTWEQVGFRFDSDPTSLGVCDFGAGPRLFVGGGFRRFDNTTFNGIAMWDGTRWTPLATGVQRSSGSGGYVYAMEAHDDGKGSGTALFVGGNFAKAGGVTASSIAKWDGSAWSWVGDSNSSVYMLRSVEIGGVKSLVAGGWFTSIGGHPGKGVAQRTGNTWSTMDGGFAGTPRVMAGTVFDFGSGSELVVGGTQFQAASHRGALGGVARWNGSQWGRLNDGDGLSSDVNCIIQSDISGTDEIYVGGSFATAGPTYVGSVARRDETGWHALAGGIAGSISRMTEHFDGVEKTLVVAGKFESVFNSADPYIGTPTEVAAKGVAFWNGTEWSAMGSGIGLGKQIVTAVASFDNGSGPAVYVSYREFISSRYVYRMMRWNGAQWDTMPVNLGDSVDQFIVHDDGSGARLYACGDELTPTHAVLRLEAGAWVGAGQSIVGDVREMIEYNDGVSGSMLYATGTFVLAGSSQTVYGARWNGARWEASPSYSGVVRKAPGGDTLYYESNNIVYEYAPGGPSKFVAWGPDNYVYDMTLVEEQGQPVLYMGGRFERVGDTASRRFARLELCTPCYADCHRSTGVGVLDIFDFLCFQDNFARGQSYACDCDTSTGSGVCDVFDFLCFQSAFVGGCP